VIVLVPGMGDLRAGYRFRAPALRAAGYRVDCTDLRGHGDSDATFASCGDEDSAGDVVALIGELGGPGVIVGNSMAAGSARRARSSAKAKSSSPGRPQPSRADLSIPDGPCPVPALAAAQNILPGAIRAVCVHTGFPEPPRGHRTAALRVRPRRLTHWAPPGSVSCAADRCGAATGQ
jgi:pimeloyl-ACP methyl ester carboxylesterase